MHISSPAAIIAYALLRTSPRRGPISVYSGTSAPACPLLLPRLFSRARMTYRGPPIVRRLLDASDSFRTSFPRPSDPIPMLRARPHYFLSIRRPIAKLAANLCSRRNEQWRLIRTGRGNVVRQDFEPALSNHRALASASGARFSSSLRMARLSGKSLEFTR